MDFLLLSHIQCADNHPHQYCCLVLVAVTGVKFLVLDLSPVVRSDSSGAHFIKGLAKDCNEKGIQMILCNPTSKVCTLLQGYNAELCSAFDAPVLSMCYGSSNASFSTHRVWVVDLWLVLRLATHEQLGVSAYDSRSKVHSRLATFLYSACCHAQARQAALPELKSQKPGDMPARWDHQMAAPVSGSCRPQQTLDADYFRLPALLFTQYSSSPCSTASTPAKCLTADGFLSTLTMVCKQL